MREQQHERADASAAQSAHTPGLVTDSLPLASYLLCKGFQPSLRASKGQLVLFAFVSSTELDEAIDQFYAGQARVEPTAFNAARIALRRRMDAVQEARR
jgi:hypothetical protein